MALMGHPSAWTLQEFCQIHPWPRHSPSLHREICADFCRQMSSDLAAQTVFDTDLSLLASHAARVSSTSLHPHTGTMGGRWPREAGSTGLRDPRSGELSNQWLAVFCSKSMWQRADTFWDRICAFRLCYLPQIMRSTAKPEQSNLQFCWIKPIVWDYDTLAKW